MPVRSRDIFRTWGLAVVILVVGFVVAYQFVEPAPPKRIVLATGVDGGAYQRYGEDFADYLATAGVEVELRATAGAVENLRLLQDSDDIDLAFVQGGIADATMYGRAPASRARLATTRRSTAGTGRS